MTLTSLRSAAGYASTALDTARSTWKAMADAAVAPETTEQPTQPTQPTAPGATTPEPSAPGQRKGQRVGVSLDAYA
jgi:hypothetical protein